MAKARRDRDEDVVRTSLVLPRETWLAVKRKALDERKEFRQIVLEALRAWLAKR